MDVKPCATSSLSNCHLSIAVNMSPTKLVTYEDEMEHLGGLRLIAWAEFIKGRDRRGGRLQGIHSLSKQPSPNGFADIQRWIVIEEDWSDQIRHLCKAHHGCIDSCASVHL